MRKSLEKNLHCPKINLDEKLIGRTLFRLKFLNFNNQYFRKVLFKHSEYILNYTLKEDSLSLRFYKLDPKNGNYWKEVFCENISKIYHTKDCHVPFWSPRLELKILA